MPSSRAPRSAARAATSPSSDPDVSRRHAEIQVSSGDILISDLGSTNGTFVNGERIDQPRTLRDGDEVRIGAVVWRLRAPAGATRLAGTMDVAAATPSQATTVRPGRRARAARGGAAHGTATS